MNNKNILLQQRDNTQHIQSILIVFMIASSIVLIAIPNVKDERVIETGGNTEIQTAAATTTTSSIPATLSNQHSNTNSYVSNYFNAWELTKVI
jgi:hypothetical protein